MKKQFVSRTCSLALLFLYALFFVTCGEAQNSKQYPYPVAEGPATTAASNFYHPCLAWNGSRLALTWQGSFLNDMEIGYLETDSAGQNLLTDRYIVYKGDSAEPVLAWTGSYFCLAWANYETNTQPPYHIFLGRIVETITFTNKVTVAGTNNRCPSLVWNGNGFGLAWQDDRLGTNHIYFNRVSADRSTTIHSPAVQVDSSTGDALCPSLVWTGSQYGVAWHDSRHGDAEIYFSRINDAGEKQGGDLRISSSEGLSWDPDLVWTGSEFGVAWGDGRNGDWDIYFRRISADGILVGDEKRITSATGNAESPSLVWTGNEYAVAWSDSRNGPYAIYLVYLDATGNKLEAERCISSGPSNCRFPSLVWANDKPCVAWCDYRGYEQSPLTDGEIYLGW